jgi:pimeloyl-ACP methyl ester carboxylesterase
VSFAAAVSFLRIPEIDYWLSAAWLVATMLLILVPASILRLRWRVVMVLVLVLAPMGPEMFGIALYIFWWTSLWPLIAILWSKDYWWLRIPVLVIGGMSSLAGSALVVPYAVLWAITRRRRDLVGTIVLGATLAAQVPTYLTSYRTGQVPFHLSMVAQQELRNFSYYLTALVTPVPSGLLLFVGACMVLVIGGYVAYSVARRAPNSNELLVLFVGLLVMGVLTAIPAPLVSDPIHAGTRYYFFPFVVLAWLLLLVAVTPRVPRSNKHWWEMQWREVPVARIVAAGMIALSLLALPRTVTRHDDQVSWPAQLARCETTTGSFSVPVQFNGRLSDMWYGRLEITPGTCQRLGYR